MADPSVNQSQCPACGTSVEEGLRFCTNCGIMLQIKAAQTGEILLGRTIANNFHLDEVIASGAMGTIFKAQQLSLGKTVVIKLLHRQMLDDPTLSMRFRREARAASRLNHPNCIQIIDFGEMDDGRLYIAMEYVDGVNLGELLHRDHPLEPQRVIHILKQVCLALDEAHANGVLHRDLKPDNIVVGDRRNLRDFTKVLDFGIAKLQESVPGAMAFQTVVGVVCGTPEYMSPEQARGEEVDGRTDLYSLGVILYQMLTNQLPFQAGSALGVVTKHLTEAPRPPSELVSDVPPSLEALTMSLMAKEREQRPPNALEVASELERLGRTLDLDGLLQPDPEASTLLDVSRVTTEPTKTGQGRGAATQPEMARTAQPDEAKRVTDVGSRSTADPTEPTGIESVESVPETALPTQDSVAAAPPPVGKGPAGLWLIAVLVGAAVALVGWILYRAMVPGVEAEATSMGTQHPQAVVAYADPDNLAAPWASDELDAQELATDEEVIAIG